MSAQEKVRALRGVCIGVEKHLAAGDVTELDSGSVQFLVSIGAVERVKDEPKPPPEPPPEPAPPEPEMAAATVETKPESTAPAKPGKKEK